MLSSMTTLNACFCTRCQKTLPAAAFSPSQAAKGRSWCRDCQNEHRKNLRSGITPKRPISTCQHCGKPIDSMRRHARWCSPSCSAKGWREANPGRHRDLYIRSTYRVESSVIEQLFSAQGRRCAICGSEDPRGKGWHIDHCHSTGSVRGVLCGPCNQGIGQLGDSVVRLKQAIAYLERT